MHLLGIVVAALAFSGSPTEGAYEWRAWNSNPAYEVYGRMESGVFRYSAFRLKQSAEAPPVRRDGTVDYGVTLEADSNLPGSIRGTAGNLGKEILEKTLADPTGDVGETDPEQRCRQPDLEPLRELEGLASFPSFTQVLIGGACVFLFIGMFLLMVFVAIVASARKRSEQ